MHRTQVVLQSHTQEQYSKSKFYFIFKCDFVEKPGIDAWIKDNVDMEKPQQIVYYQTPKDASFSKERSSIVSEKESKVETKKGLFELVSESVKEYVVETKIVTSSETTIV